MAEIVPLTQGHLEHYQDVLRRLMEEVNGRWQERVELVSKRFELHLWLAPPATHAYPYYLAFLTQVRERTENGRFKLSQDEQRGLMIRAALASGWLIEAPWKVEEVPALPANLAAWLGKRLDEVYSDYDYDVDVAQVKAALEAGWFETVAVLPEEAEALEALALAVKNANREARQIDPE